jgi:hypothetical protein
MTSSFSTFRMILLIGVPIVLVVLWYLLRGLFSKDDDSNNRTDRS